MNDKFASLKNEINECFYEIVGIINEVIGHRTDSFSEMLELSEQIHSGSENFVAETGKITSVISEDINSRISDLNMNQMKKDIVDATHTFLEITEELELLSYNTICRTMALGEKGATITHISKEIKKYSTTVKSLLDVITVEFNRIFANFREVSEHLMKNSLVPDSISMETDSNEDVIITSDASVLIENSQFHDIFMQELEIINAAVADSRFSTSYEAGRIFGVYEKSVGKLDFIKYALQDKLDNIKSVMGDFIYVFNTDMQNIVSKTHILRSELDRVHGLTHNTCETISSLKTSIAGSRSMMQATKNHINALAKQSKTFRNLVVITAVEVARINDESLRSVVVSMTKTEEELNGLIAKLNSNIEMWDTLRTDFMSTFNNAESGMAFVCKPGEYGERDMVMQKAHELDGRLDALRKVFLNDKYVSFFDSTTERLMELFGEYIDYIQESFSSFNERMTDDILNSEEFTQGRNEAELKDILASENEQSSIEFF
jgi:hypothetical protein